MTARRSAATAATAVVAAVATLAALAVGACASPGPAPDPTAVPTVPTAIASTATLAACPDPGVAIRIGDVDGAMGLRALTVSMTNCGDRPYQVDGYPVVRVLGDDHKPLDVRVAPGGSDLTVDPALTAAPRPVTLQPGGTATAVVMWRNLVTDPTVVATTGTYLDIAPAAGAPAQTVTPHGGIDLGNTGKLAVGPWTAAPRSAPAPSEPAQVPPAP